jgi:hypothetical protein
MQTENSPFLQMQIQGHSWLINADYIVSAQFKGTVAVVLKMVNGDTIEVPYHQELMTQIKQRHQSLNRS